MTQIENPAHNHEYMSFINYRHGAVLIHIEIRSIYLKISIYTETQALTVLWVAKREREIKL